MKEKNTLLSQNGSMNRRVFLRTSGLLGIGLASGSIVPAVAEAVKFNSKAYKVSKTRLAMGTFVSMTLIHPSKDKAEEAMGLAFEEIERLTALLNRFDGSTAVGHLNKEGVLHDIPPEVAQVVSQGIKYFELTKGTFDISVKPVVDLFKGKLKDGKFSPPNESEISRLLTKIGSDKIELKNRTIRFKENGMGITLDGIAKGFIVDKASEILSKHKIANYLINAGGDIRTLGKPNDKRSWTVAIQDPRKNKKYPDIVHMNNGSIATSGNYEVYFDREKLFHHIVNPQTGLSPETSTSVSVIAPTAMDADALSTSVFVMRPSGGVNFINSLPHCECLTISKDNKKVKSAGWRSAAI